MCTDGMDSAGRPSSETCSTTKGDEPPMKPSCPGILIEQSPMEGECALGDDCEARTLLDTDYPAYRLAHQNRRPAWVTDEELGGEG